VAFEVVLIYRDAVTMVGMDTFVVANSVVIGLSFIDCIILIRLQALARLTFLMTGGKLPLCGVMNKL
jgi:hypothetical protein